MFPRVVACLLICLPLCLPPSSWAQDLSTVVERIRPSIVGVGVWSPTESPRAKLRGTGFVVGDGRHVVTAAHVLTTLPDVEKNEKLVIFVGRGPSASFRDARTLSSDALHDVALMKIEGDAIPALKLGAADEVREGWEMFFTGFPIGAVLGLYPATHRAGIAAITPNFTPAAKAGDLTVKQIRGADTRYQVFQLDGISYPGNSGSPLLHADSGKVYGVVNSTFLKSTKEGALTNPSGISYAIPSRHVRDLMNQAGVRE
jgi:S1-C subfamily serine protease